MAKEPDVPWTAADAKRRGWDSPLVYGRSLASAMREQVVEFVDPEDRDGRRECLTQGVFDRSRRRGRLRVLGVFTL